MILAPVGPKSAYSLIFVFCSPKSNHCPLAARPWRRSLLAVDYIVSDICLQFKRENVPFTNKVCIVYDIPLWVTTR